MNCIDSFLDAQHYWNASQTLDKQILLKKKTKTQTFFGEKKQQANTKC